MSSTAVYFVPNYFGLSSVKVISTNNSVPKLRHKKLNKTKCDFLDQIRLVRSSPDSPPPGGEGGNIPVFSGGLSENECKYLNERDHKICTASESIGGRANFFLPTCKEVPGAYSDQRGTAGHTWNTPKKWFFWLKEAERGWKSGARPLSWKSRWKPSIIREFWHQRI